MWFWHCCLYCSLFWICSFIVIPRKKSGLTEGGNWIHHPGLPWKDSCIIWSEIVVQQVMNFTLTSLDFKKCEIVWITFSIYIAVKRFYFHAMQVIARSKPFVLHFRLFCLSIVACDVSVSFLNACYIGFGAVFFCTYEKYKPLKNSTGSPQQRRTSACHCVTFAALMLCARSTAFTLLQLDSHTHLSFVALVPIIVRTVLMNFFWPTSRKFLSNFWTICPIGVQVAQTVVHFANIQIQARKRGVFGRGWVCFVYVHIPERGCDGGVKNTG